MHEKTYSNREAVLFLWRVHNRVNLRLAGDKSEDPAHPKVPFPTVEQCTQCRTVSSPDQWHEAGVLEFLVDAYSEDNIQGIATGNAIDKRGEGGNAIDKSGEGENAIDKRVEGATVDITLAHKMVDMSRIDFGLCFAFYMLSCIIIVLGYLHLKRLRRPSGRSSLPV